MPKYNVFWSKTYYVSGYTEVDADDRAHAEYIALSNIGDYEGSSQHDPDGDYAECYGEVESE